MAKNDYQYPEVSLGFAQTIQPVSFPGLNYSRFQVGAQVSVQTGSTYAVQALKTTELGIQVTTHGVGPIPHEFYIPYANVAFFTAVKVGG